jgi:hypothetical protein
MVRAIAGVVLAGVILLCSACSSAGTKAASTPPSGSAAAATAKSTAKQINKTMTLVDGDASAVVTLISVDTATMGGMNTKPESGTFTLFHLKMECKSGTFSTNSLYARLRTASGAIVSENDGQGGSHSLIQPSLKLTRLAPGEKAEGDVIFDTKLEPGASFFWADPNDKPLAVWEL